MFKIRIPLGDFTSVRDALPHILQDATSLSIRAIVLVLAPHLDIQFR